MIDEDTAPLVRYVFEAYAKGTSKKDIMAELTRRGYKNTKNKPLTLNSFQNNLTSRKYIGEVEHDGVVYTNIYPPLIDKATFETVQKRLARRKQAPAALKAKEDYILQGKAFCGHCGARMVGVSGTGRAATYYYYACGKKYKYHTCDKRSERKDFLEQLVVELTLEYVLEHKRMREAKSGEMPKAVQRASPLALAFPFCDLPNLCRHVLVWRSLPGSTQRHERSEWLCGVKAAPLVIDKHMSWCQTKFYNKQYLITYVVLYFVNKEAV